MVKNGALVHAAHPEGNTIDPAVHTKYVEGDIDLEHIYLNVGTLLKMLYVSTDPYIRLRMRDPSVLFFIATISLGEPYVPCRFALS